MFWIFRVASVQVLLAVGRQPERHQSPACRRAMSCLNDRASSLDPQLAVRAAVGDIALLEHVLVLVKFEDRFPGANLGEKDFAVEHVLGWVSHGISFRLNVLNRRLAAKRQAYFRTLKETVSVDLCVPKTKSERIDDEVHPR
jgi:hypothetical protein